jgi:hypothetical protein
MDLAKFRTEAALEDEGVWIELGEGARARVGRIGGRRYRDAFQRHLKPFQKAARLGALSETQAERILVETLADAVLLGWEGLTQDGAPVPYDRDRARDLLADPAFRDFRNLIVETANEAESFRRAAERDAEKNSVARCAGSSTGAPISTS